MHCPLQRGSDWQITVLKIYGTCHLDKPLLYVNGCERADDGHPKATFLQVPFSLQEVKRVKFVSTYEMERQDTVVSAWLKYRKSKYNVKREVR